MATKLTAQMSKKLTAMGISAKSEEAAREKLLAILAKEGIDGMEGEDTDILIDMAESFIEVADEVNDEEEEEVEDINEEEVEDINEEEGEDDIEALADEVETEDAMNESSAEEEADEEEADEEEADEVEEKPTKKEIKKEEKKKDKKKDKKPAEKERKMGAKGMKLNPKAIAEDRKYFSALYELFPEKEFEYNWIVSSGVTIKSIGKNSKRAVFAVDNASLQADGSIICTLYLMTFGKNTEKIEELGLDYKVTWSGVPFIKGVTMDEVMDIIHQTYDETMAFVGKLDKRLGDNRKKMEEAIKK